MNVSAATGVQLSEAVLARFRDARHAGTLSADGGHLGNGTAGTVKSGTVVEIQLRLDAEGVVRALAWRAFGCPSTMAACSWLGDAAVGRDHAAAAALGVAELEAALDFDARVRSRILVVEDAYRAALAAAVQKL